MKISEFKKWYQRAQQVNIVNDDVFNCAVHFWISLTELQHKKMYSLLIFQGNVPIDGEIRMANGLGILDIDTESEVKIWNT